MDITTEMFASKPMTKLMDPAEHEQQQPEGPDIVRALIGEGIKRRRVALHPAPVAGHKICRGDKKEDAKKHELSGVNPAEIRVEFREGFIRVPSSEADVQHAGLVDASFAFVTDAFEHSEIFFAEGAFPHGRLNRIEKFENLGFCDCGVRVLLRERF